MSYKDPQKQREYQREWARAKRSKVSSNDRAVELEWRLNSVDDIVAIVEIMITELMCAKDLDLGIRARLVFKGDEVSLRLLEQSDLELRMQVVEERLGITASQ